MNRELLSYGVGIVCALLALYNFISLLRPSKIRVNPDRATATIAGSSDYLNIFKANLAELKIKVSVIAEHSNEYMFLLHDNQWTVVLGILSKLDHINQELYLLQKRGNDEMAYALASVVTRPVGKISDEVRAITSVDLDSLENWPQRCDEILINCTKALEVAAHETKNLGIERKRKRQPTLMAMQEMRKLLNEDERE